MTLKDLISSGLMKDTDSVTVTKPLTGSAFDMRKGNWFHDQILGYLDAEVRAFSWSEEGGYSVALK